MVFIKFSIFYFLFKRLKIQNYILFKHFTTTYLLDVDGRTWMTSNEVKN